MHRLAELWDRECCLNNSWGGKPSEAPAADPPPPLEPHFHHLLREESLMGFRGKYQTKASDWTFHATHSVSNGNYATMREVTREVKVCCARLQCDLLVWETMAKFQSAFMVRIEDSWRPQSPAVSVCIKHNCSMACHVLTMAYMRCPVQYFVDIQKIM